MHLKKKRWSNDDTELTLLALPSILWYALFCFLPMFGIIIAFKTYRVQAGRSFVYSLLVSPNAGFKNFEFILKANKLAILLRNTLLYNVVFIVLGIVVPVVLAIMINELYSRWKSKAYQTMMFFPFFMSWVIVSYIVYVFLNADSGILNRFITAHGGEAVNWYAEPKYWPLILVLTGLWKSTGYGMIVYLAQITGIDKSFYEAAAIDGATKLQQIRYLHGFRTVLSSYAANPRQLSRYGFDAGYVCISGVADGSADWDDLGGYCDAVGCLLYNHPAC